MRRQGALGALCALLLALVATGVSAQDDAALTLRIWGGGMPPGSEMTIAWTPGQGLQFGNLRQAEVGPGGTLYYSSDPHWVELTIGPSLAGGVARTIRLRGLDEAVRRAGDAGGLPALKQLVDRIYLLALQARGVQ